MYKAFINQSKNVSPPELNILGAESFNHTGGGQNKCKGVIGGSVEDVYYSKEEYKSLSSDQIAALYKKIQARGHKPVEKKVRSKGGGSKEDLVKQVSAMVDVIKSAPEAPVTATPKTNSKNPALTRQRILCE